MFVTPAYQRYQLSAICFDQRVRAIEKLARAGIKAQQVVIADDENLLLASERDFYTVERDNQWLGRRFNDGYELAGRVGATHVFPIGSDSWCDPQWIIDAALKMADDVVVASRHYTRFDTDGRKRQQLWVPVLQGVSYVLPVKMLEACGYRPCQDEIARGCDGATWDTIRRTSSFKMEWSESHAYETPSFESHPQITKFKKLGMRWGKGLEEGDHVLSVLRGHFDGDLVDRIEEFYRQRRQGVQETTKVEQRAKLIAQRVLNSNRVPSDVRRRTRQYIEEGVRIALTEQ